MFANFFNWPAVASEFLELESSSLIQSWLYDEAETRNAPPTILGNYVRHITLCGAHFSHSHHTDNVFEELGLAFIEKRSPLIYAASRMCTTVANSIRNKGIHLEGKALVAPICWGIAGDRGCWEGASLLPLFFEVPTISPTSRVPFVSVL